MYLKPNGCVIPTLHRDYSEWHHGRSIYALWYILVERDQYTELVAKLDQLQASFSDLLLPNSQRQYHITLYICGFLTEQKPVYNDDFCIDWFEQQRRKLLKQTAFQLNISKLNSFSSALFADIRDEKIISLICDETFNLMIIRKLQLCNIIRILHLDCIAMLIPVM